jgi:hypothetical protein
MADRQNREDEDNPLFDEAPRGVADNEDFEEVDDLDEELEDEDLDDPKGRAIDEDEPSPGERGYTGEVGSEGGSRGDIEVDRNRPGTLGGSEATSTISHADDEAGFGDRQKGPGY